MPMKIFFLNYGKKIRPPTNKFSFPKQFGVAGIV